MTLTFELPSELEENLRQSYGNLGQAAKEAFLIELYRRDQITRYELSTALGLERFQTDALLKHYNVTEDLPTEQELMEDFQRFLPLVKK